MYASVPFIQTKQYHVQCYVKDWIPTQAVSVSGAANSPAAAVITVQTNVDGSSHAISFANLVLNIFASRRLI